MWIGNNTDKQKDRCIGKHIRRKNNRQICRIDRDRYRDKKISQCRSRYVDDNECRLID